MHNDIYNRRCIVLKILIILLTMSSLWSIEIDREYLKKELTNNPNDLMTRVILARSYISECNFKQAGVMIDEVLDIDRDHQKARALKKEITALKKIASLVKTDVLSDSTKLTAYFDKLYQRGEYEYITMIYDVLKRNNIKFDAKVDNYTIESHTHLQHYTKALALADSLQESRQNIYFYKAKVYSAKGDDKESERYYRFALHEGERADIVVSLYEHYIKRGKHKEVEALKDKYQAKNPSSSISAALDAKVKIYKMQKLTYLQKTYAQSAAFKTLKPYYFALESSGERQKALDLLTQHVQKHPKDEEAALFLAKRLYWDKKRQASLSYLEPFMTKTQNRETLKLYTDILTELGRDDKAIPHLKKLANLDGNSERINAKIAAVQRGLLLKTAVDAHKEKRYPAAIKGYIDYYDQTGDEKIAKEIAELYFFQSESSKSLPYYKAYLDRYEDDHNVRFRYASALVQAKDYQAAEREFYSVSLADNALSSLARYHYAQSLMAQKREQKWSRAKEVLSGLLQTLEREQFSKERDELLKFTKIALHKASAPMPKPTRHKDVMLAEGQRKIIEKENVFAVSDIEKRDIGSVKSMLMPFGSSAKAPLKDSITLSIHTLEDDTINNLSYGVRFNDVTEIEEGALSFEVKKTRFKNAHSRHTVDGFSAHYKKEVFGVELGVNRIKDYGDLIAKLSFEKALSGHNLSMSLGYLNGAFVNSQVCMIDEEISAVQFSLYDAILFSNLKQAEVSFQVNSYSDGNINLNSWVDYPIYQVRNEAFENEVAFSGSYAYNSKLEGCYYPERFFDGNFIQVRPKYIFAKLGYIQGIGGAGYSFENSDLLYNYGVVMGLSIYQLFDITIDCRHYQSGYSPDGANACHAKAAYIW